jgi:hypothetical protein
MQDCRSRGLEGTKSKQKTLQGLKMHCTGQQGKEKHSRFECLQGSKTLASTTADLQWRLPDRSSQQYIQNMQIALLTSGTCPKGMG